MNHVITQEMMEFKGKNKKEKEVDKRSEDRKKEVKK